MYELVQQHKGANIQVPCNDEGEARRQAEAAARLGYDAFYRLFGPNGFIIAYSVLDGEVKEHHDVTFPKAHW